MELENQSTKQTYIKLLVDTLKKKSEVLGHLMELTELQESIINLEPFDEDQFLDVVSKKEEQLEVLATLDNGFEQLYDSVKVELTEGKMNYVEEIQEMKELITLITDYSVKLQAMEKRNRAKLEIIFSNKRIEIKNARASNRMVTNYYKSATQQQVPQSYFYDKKK